MRVRYFVFVLAGAALAQTGCAIGFRGETGWPVSPPVMPADSVSGQPNPDPTPNVAPQIHPLPPR
jgi:hypothetical protein